MAIIGRSGSEVWWPWRWPCFNPRNTQAFYVTKTQKESRCGQKAMERKRSVYVFVAFWMAERSTREREQGESYGKNSNEAHSPDLMNQKKYNHRGHIKVTPMYKPLFDLYSHHCICLLAIFNHLSSRCLLFSFTQIPICNISYQGIQLPDPNINPMKAGFHWFPSWVNGTLH